MSLFTTYILSTNHSARFAKENFPVCHDLKKMRVLRPELKIIYNAFLFINPTFVF